MLIDTPVRPLGVVASEPLAERVLACPEEVWFTDNRRQNEFEVHAQTESIILVFFSGWPAVTVSHADGWERFHDVTMPVIQDIVARHYAPTGMLLRVMLARLLPARRIDAHIDVHPSFSVAHRIHIPLITNPEVDFEVGGERVATRPHHAFELNNKMAHSVVNRGLTPRIHLIFDYAPDQD